MCFLLKERAAVINLLLPYDFMLSHASMQRLVFSQTKLEVRPRRTEGLKI